MKKCPQCGVEYADDNTLCPADGAALETTDDNLIGKTLAGKYRIDERLKDGGMGMVYRGTHILMDKTVAIKVLRPSLAADEKIVARFSREARAASRISHPNALSVTDFGEDENGVVFLVMEYLNGKTLKQVIRENGPLPLARVVDIMRQVGDALSVAHAQGVVHRDLKSDNIMLLTTAVGEHAKVLDFGIAKINEAEGVVDPGLTAPNLVMGTPHYMSPEQCSQSSEIDQRSDIYSFGVILYEMLVGHVPFSGESPTIVMMKQLQEPVPSILEERDDVPPSVARVVARATAKVPGNRYQTVDALIEDLTIAAGMTIHQLNGGSGTPVAPGMDDDESTMVRPRAVEPITPVPQVPSGRRAPVTIPIAPALPVEAAKAFNPLKILVPAAAALLIVFALVYFFTRNAETGNQQNMNQPSLIADPNSKPVEPAQPATGKNEQGIPAGGTFVPPTNVNANVNANANAQPSVTPLEDETNPNINANQNTNANANVNSNVNRKAPALPEPTRSVNPEAVPPGPSPASSKPPVPKPSPATAEATPPR
jgi:eukaryotic-like serine/threonine-protein kinase